MFANWSLFCYALLSVLSIFQLSWRERERERERAGCFTLIVFQMYCDR